MNPMPMPENPEGTFEATARCESFVLPEFRIALVLQCQDMRRGLDGIRCCLTAKSLEAVQKAHLYTNWPAELQKGAAAKTSSKASKSSKDIPGETAGVAGDPPRDGDGGGAPAAETLEIPKTPAQSQARQ